MKNFSEFLESISSPLPPTIKVGGKLRSTINSDGEYIHSKIEDIKKFWEWFGDSKIVDDDGRPLVVYHGTREEIDKFHTDYSNAIYLHNTIIFNWKLRNITYILHIQICFHLFLNKITFI